MPKVSFEPLPEASATPRPSIMRLTLFASGDFACNLYWQSISLFLLFFYTEILRLPPALAGLIYMAGAIWDGFADLGVGILAQRTGVSYRRFVARSAVPLGVFFTALYVSEPLSPTALAIAAFGAQIGFRTFYALVNVPYIAWGTRVSSDSRDRTTLAGLRMAFGAAAAVLVALGTPWIAARAALAGAGGQGFLIAALLFAVVGTVMLLIVASATPEAAPARLGPQGPSIAACWRALGGNRAFVTLNVAAAAVGMAAALINQSVLYYFLHVARDPSAGSETLAVMGVAGVLSVPAWMGLTRRFGVRAIWFSAAAAGLATVMAFALLGDRSSNDARAFLVLIQIVLTAFNLGFWAMLPDTVEYGERRGGVRVEAMAFGVSALLQKMALATAAGVLGLAYSRIGYVANAVQTEATIAGIRTIILAAPAIGLFVSAIVMLANPLKRGVHAAIVEQLAADRH